MLGYRGKILKVELSSGEISEMPIDPDIARDYIGGAGYACRILYDMIDAKTDPLGPENPLFILAGPFTGTMVPTGSKTSFCAKSPQTGLWAHSTVGGHMGADLKFAGYDAIVFTGASKNPVYLNIKDDDVQLLDAEAAGIWGKDVFETDDLLKAIHGKRARTLAIGQAGENLVRFAAVTNDRDRASARSGLGAVMGA